MKLYDFLKFWLENPIQSCFGVYLGDNTPTISFLFVQTTKRHFLAAGRVVQAINHSNRFRRFAWACVQRNVFFGWDLPILAKFWVVWGQGLTQFSIFQLIPPREKNARQTVSFETLMIKIGSGVFTELAFKESDTYIHTYIHT